MGQLGGTNAQQNTLTDSFASIADDANCAMDWVYYANYGRFCGTALPAIVPGSTITPFLFQFVTDSIETGDDATANNGFKLDYTQTVC